MWQNRSLRSTVQRKNQKIETLENTNQRQSQTSQSLHSRNSTCLDVFFVLSRFKNHTLLQSKFNQSQHEITPRGNNPHHLLLSFTLRPHHISLFLSFSTHFHHVCSTELVSLHLPKETFIMSTTAISIHETHNHQNHSPQPPSLLRSRPRRNPPDEREDPMPRAHGNRLRQSPLSQPFPPLGLSRLRRVRPQLPPVKRNLPERPPEDLGDVS